MQKTKNINRNIFREYDIRGIADTDLTDDAIYTIGLSYGSYIQKNTNHKVIIGHDNRLSSPRITKALTEGLLDSGVDVIDLGLVTTPMLYYAKIYLKIYTGIMITASHNPKEYNGLKISFSKVGNAYGKLITDFCDYTFSDKYSASKQKGNLSQFDIKQEYLNNIKNSISLGDKKIKAVFDCGNGTGSIIVKEILDMFNIEYDLLYCESDGTFPNHGADPSVKENMIDLSKKVKELGYDIGIGIDGDADRVGVVLENGEYISADLLMLIIYRYLAPNMHNKKALFDVKCSRSLIDGLKEIGLELNMRRTGASYTNLYMQGNLDDPTDDFDFGGEYSGHLFFRDKYQGFDDGIYSGLRTIEILSKTNKTISELLEPLSKYYSTEMQSVKVTEETKFEIVQKIKEYVQNKNYEFSDIDGVRVEFDDGWAAVRASNTSPTLTTRYEAKTKERLAEIEQEFTQLINNIITKENKSSNIS